MKKLKVCLAQIEVHPGEPHRNADKMLWCIEKAKKDSADLICFSELAIPGYLLGDQWERESFIYDCQEAAQKVIAASHGIYVAFGNIVLDTTKVNEDGRGRKYNACIVAHNGASLGSAGLFQDTMAIKTLMPNYREFDDSRHFYDSRKMMFDSLMERNENVNERLAQYGPAVRNVFRNQYDTLTVNGIYIGFALCEDGWTTDYSFNPLDRFAGCDVIFNLSCSPYTFNKNNKRNRVFGENARKHKTCIVYVNNVGCQNNGKNVFTFDGGSCVYDKNGNSLAPYEPFQEGCLTLEIDVDAGFGKSDTKEEDIGDLYKAIKYGTKKLMDQQNLKTVVIGASGGIDSCLAAAIYADILPPEDLVLVNMPSKYNSKTTIGIAEQLAANIGCRYISHSIQDVVNSLTLSLPDAFDAAKNQFNRNHKLTPYMLENIQARARLQILAGIASMIGGVFTCNANKSEATVGYCTLYGDLGGFLANLADLWKGQIYEMARWYNANICHLIPEAAFTVKPSAELSLDQNVDEGKGDPLVYPYHDRLFWSWVERWERATPEDNLKWYLDGTIDIELGLENGFDHDGKHYSSVKELFPDKEVFTNDLRRWWNLHNGLGVVKRIQSPPILSVSRRSFGFDMRESLGKGTFSQKYYRMLEK